jgi:putative membrane protein
MAQWLFRVLKGAFIGVGAILPGISGGVLMVVLGVYRPIMAFLAHPVREFKRHALFLLPVLIGAAVGVVLLARVVDWLFRTSETPAVWLFIGLVVGTLPSLYREAGEQGRGAKAWLALALGAALMGGWMYLLARQGVQVTPNIAWWALAGVLWGLGFLVPGMSPSSFFIFFGLYQPMTEALGKLDFAVLLPMGLGLLATVGLLARGMNALLHRAYPVVMHAILGVVFASTVAIMPLEASASPDVLLYVLCFVIGCAAALGMDLLGKRMKK